MKILEEYRSPNWNARPVGSPIDTVILHYTGMLSGEAALERLSDPQAEVSAHYLIEEDGRVFRLVEEEHRAWHAGVSQWQGRQNLNHTSIGIELVNPGHEFGYRPFPKEQIDALLELLSRVKARHQIPLQRFLGHSDIAPHRKADPGELFPWKTLAKEGFGIFSYEKSEDKTSILCVGDSGPELNNLNKQLGIIGYHGYECDKLGTGTEGVLKAFQAHWRPSAVTGEYDRGTALVINDIADRIL